MMTKEEIVRYYHLLGYYYETLLGALYARKMVSDRLAEKCRKDFYDRLAQEKELHLRRVYEYEDAMRMFFRVMDEGSDSLVSLTEIARKYSQDPPGYTIQSWMRSKNTIAYLRIWELINNHAFDDEACAKLMEESSKKSFTLTPSMWIEKTKAIGLTVKRGRGGGVFANVDISMDFRLWIDPNFRHHLIWFVREH